MWPDRWSARIRPAICGFGLVVALAGCEQSGSGSKQAVFVLGVQDEASGSLQDLSFDPEHGRELLAGALSDSRTLRWVDERLAQAYRAELVVALVSERESERDGELGVYRAVQVDLTLQRNQAGVRDRISAQGKAFLVQDPGRTTRQTGFEAVLELAIGRAVGLIDLQLEARALPIEQVASRIDTAKADERLYLLRSLRDRETPELVPVVIGLLADADDEIVLEAVGVLVSQRDRRAVGPLIRMSQTRDPVFQLQIITAMAELGGPVARGYLFTLAAGHGESEIRKRARQGLERILAEEQGQLETEVQDQALALPRSGTSDGGHPKRGTK